MGFSGSHWDAVAGGMPLPMFGESFQVRSLARDSRA